MPYNESDRQQLVYSARKRWLNDPNGLFSLNGTYHMFHQYNPFGAHWGNMHWNHAVSTDLIHWQELGIVLAPDEAGTMFSGGGLILKGGQAFALAAPSLESLPLLFYTAAGTVHTQNVAVSTESSPCNLSGHEISPPTPKE